MQALQSGVEESSECVMAGLYPATVAIPPAVSGSFELIIAAAPRNELHDVWMFCWSLDLLSWQLAFVLSGECHKHEAGPADPHQL